MQIRSLGREDPLEEGTATHSGLLAWRIPSTDEAYRATVHRVAKSQTRLSTLALQKQKYVIFLKASFLTSPRLLACIHLLLNPCRHFTIHFLISFSLHFSLSP